MLEYFNNTDKILSTYFVLEKEKNDAKLENFKKEYSIDTLTDEIVQGRVPEISDFDFGGQSEAFFRKISEFTPDDETLFFIEFLTTDFGSNAMKQNRLSIHINTGDLYYDGVNTGKSLYDFIVSEKNITKKRIKQKLYYGGTFKQYLSELLPGFDANADAKLDTLKNKSIKYLFYRYNDTLLYAGMEPASIIHTNLSADEIVMENLRNRDWQYLIESLIYKTEKNKDYYKIKTTEDSEMVQDVTKNYKLLRTIHHDFYTAIAENFQYYLGTLTQSDFEEID